MRQVSGAGRMGRFMIATFTDLLLRVALAEILSRTGLETTGIWISWPIGWAVSMVLSIALYAAIRWIPEKTPEFELLGQEPAGETIEDVESPSEYL